MLRPPLTVIACGDSLTQGVGDETGLGWLSRLTAMLPDPHEVTTYNLGVRGNTSLDLSRRIEAELTARLQPTARNLLLLCIGTNDTAKYRGQLRVPHSRSLKLTGRIVQEMKRFGTVLWISPVPVAREELIFEREAGEKFSFRDERLRALSLDFQRMADEQGIAYLDLFASWKTLAEHFNERPDGIHPTSRGYAALARVISEWSAWVAATS